MSDTVTQATTEPVQVAQTPVETKSAGKMGINDLSRKLAGNKTPYSFAVSPVPAVKTEAAPVTEAAPAPSAEVKETETKTEGGESQETPAETAEATETEIEEVPSHETSSLDPKLQEKINRRIGKEVGKTKKALERAAAAEAKAAELESRLSQAPQEVEKEVHVPVPSNVPLPEITTIEQLNSYRENLANDIVEAEMLLHYDIPPEGIDTKWGKMTKPALIAALTQAKKDERIAIPAREKFLTTRTQATQTAQEDFPFLKDPTSDGYKMFQQAKRDPANAVLRAFPNSEYLIAMVVEGKLAVQARKSAQPEAKAPVKPKQKPTNGQSEIASDASPTRAPTGMLAANALQSERAKIVGSKKSLGHKDFAALLLANQRNRNSQ